jgi:hypothetical protein
VPSAIDQVSRYIGNGPHTVNMGDTLFGIFTGGNDALFDANASAAQTIKTIVSIMEDLRQNGEFSVFCMRLGVGQSFYSVVLCKARSTSSSRHIPTSLSCLTGHMLVLPSINNLTHTPPNFVPLCGPCRGLTWLTRTSTNCSMTCSRIRIGTGMTERR